MTELAATVGLVVIGIWMACVLIVGMTLLVNLLVNWWEDRG